MSQTTDVVSGPLASRLTQARSTPQDIHVRVVKHMGHVYYVVFKDHTTAFITDVWVRNFKAHNQRECLWTHWRPTPLTQRLKNICAKAIQQKQ